jgi:Holliday junction resolvase RusA-like endonuclease
MTIIKFTVKGEPASKSNSRKLATIGGRNVMIDGKRTRVGGRAAFIKSDKARNYEYSALLQIPANAKQMLTGRLRMTIRIFYATERSDLDESVILDILQARYAKAEEGKPRELVRRGVYLNDRQVRERHVYHAIDKNNPRAEIEIETLEAQQTGLELLEPADDDLETEPF